MKATMTVGLLLLSAGLFIISRLDVGSGYLPFLGGLILVGFDIGLSGAVGTSAITGSLGRGQQGVASAMNDTTREVGSAVGIPLMGSIYGSRYRSNLHDALDQLPAEAARDSAAAGLHVADQLGTRGAALTDGIRSAFMDGLSTSLIAVSAGTPLGLPGYPTGRIVPLWLRSQIQRPREQRWKTNRMTIRTHYACTHSQLHGNASPERSGEASSHGSGQRPTKDAPQRSLDPSPALSRVCHQLRRRPGP
ncbi:hypothetical protein [Streptomyces sp. NPDC000351]|uniref:hypothetical protein n=2 Tax=Streptomyces TaxID=1883 RepID=UPI00331E000D